MGGFTSNEASYTGYDKIMNQIANTYISTAQYVSEHQNITVRSNSVENVDLDSGTKSYFADNTSDKDKIQINQFNKCFTNDLKNKLGISSTEYKVISKYIEGKKLGDIIDKDGHLIINEKELKDIYSNLYGVNAVRSNSNGGPNSETLAGSVVDKLKNALKDSYFGNDYSETLKEATIAEVTSDKNGYDSIVYEKDGEYWLINTCADGNSKEDDFLILYSSLYANLGGDEFFNYISPILANSDQTVTIPGIGDVKYKDIAKAKKIYENQREKSYKMLEKYAKKGTVNVGGYSMGGGIQLDTYIRYVENNPDKAKNIHIDLYNPYIGFVEGNSDYVEKGQSLIAGKQAKIKEIVEKYGDNIRIYCNEGDVVSQFNSVIDCFGDRVTYLIPDKNVPVTLDNFNGDVMALIVGNDKNSCRHGLEAINYDDTFDANGNVVKQGKQITLNEIAGGKYKSNAISSLINDAFSSGILAGKDALEKFNLGDSEYAKPGLLKMYDELLEYVKNNPGNISYEGMIEAISPALLDILKAGAVREGGSAFGEFVVCLVNEPLENEQVKETTTKFFMKKENQEQIKNLIGNILTGWDDNVNTEIGNFAKKKGTELYWEILSEHYPNRAIVLSGLQKIQSDDIVKKAIGVAQTGGTIISKGWDGVVDVWNSFLGLLSF